MGEHDFGEVLPTRPRGSSARRRWRWPGFAAVAVYGFVVSLGGQQLFKDAI